VEKAPIDPLLFIARFWPNIRLYDKQREILHSVWNDDETVVVAGNMLGKDYIASLVALTFFLIHVHDPVRVLTTSVKDEHLDVLWGEIDARIAECSVALTTDKGGPLVYNHHEIRKVTKGRLDKLSYLKGQVSKQGEGLSGHHATYTLLIGDEASGLSQEVYKKASAWAKRMLFIGNPWPCSNFFKRAVKGEQGTSDHGGDIPAPDGSRFYRKVFRIRAEDSPSVRWGLAQARVGLTPTDEALIPGVLTYSEYLKRRATWDKIRQCIGLDADFYEGAELLLYPPDWLNLAEQRAEQLRGINRKAKAIGHDSGEGSAESVWVAVDELGIVDLLALKTPDTADIPPQTIAFMRKHNVPPEMVFLDRGGGGKQHADALRRLGYNVQTVAFGESVIAPKRVQGYVATVAERVHADEERYTYVNRRAEMYGLASQRLEPITGSDGKQISRFAIPAEYAELRRQLAPVPRRYDGEGRLRLPPKRKKNPQSTEETMQDLIGCSPDQADALVLAVFGMSGAGKTRGFKIRVA
jgi:hypothetical protein